MNKVLKKILIVLLVVIFILGIIAWIFFGRILPMIENLNNLIEKAELISNDIDYSAVDISRPTVNTLDTLVNKCNNAGINIFDDKIINLNKLQTNTFNITTVTFSSEEMTQLLNILVNSESCRVLGVNNISFVGSNVVGLKIINASRIKFFIKPAPATLYTNSSIIQLIDDNLYVYSTTDFSLIDNSYAVVNNMTINSIDGENSEQIISLLDYFGKVTIKNYTDNMTKYYLNLVKAFANKLNAEISFSSLGMTLTPKE